MELFERKEKRKRVAILDLVRKEKLKQHIPRNFCSLRAEKGRKIDTETWKKKK